MAKGKQVVVDRWEHPTPIDDATFAFPTNVVETLMPPYAELRETIPPAKWVKFQRDWFFKGIQTLAGIVAKPGIDRDVALRHLAAIQGSFEPKHEHKEAAVAHLASRWFDDASTW